MIKSKFLSLLIFLFLSAPAVAQDAEMADGLRAEGKIYVVVVMILIVLIGLFAYLFLLDRKLNKMEKQLNEKKQTKR